MAKINPRLIAAKLCAAATGRAFRASPVSAQSTNVTLRLKSQKSSKLVVMLLLPLAVVLTCVQNAHAATKYVAKTGSDSNSGDTIGAAYLTIAKGLQNIGTAGTLYIAAGTYAESIVNSVPSGTSDTNRTLISGYQTDVVIVQPPSGTDMAVRLEGNYSYITFDKLIIDAVNCSNNAVKLGSLDGVIAARYINITNCELKNSGNQGITIGSVSQYVWVYRTKIHDNGTTDLEHGIYLSGSYSTIQECDVYNHVGLGIQIYKSGGTNGVHASYNKVIACNFHANGTSGTVAGLGVFIGDGNQVYNNLVWNNNNGISTNYGASNTEIYNNTVYANNIAGGQGINIHSATGAGTILRNNISYGNNVSNYSASRSVTESNNLWDGTNPQFQSTTPSNANFLKIGSSSPAKNAGTNTAPINTLVTTDYWGESRPQESVYDIGADEFLSGVPAAPSSLTATKAASPDNYRQINLSWTNVANETGYKIERKKGSGGTYSQIATTGANVVTYNDATCGSGTTYYYRVRAYNGSGDGGYSPEANATTDEITSGRQGHWKLNETTGTNANDETANNNDGTLTGGPAWVAAKIGNGLNFDGVDDVVNCGSGSTLDNLAAITVAAWIKADTMGEGGFGRIVQKAAGTAPTAGWDFHVATNQIQFRVDYATTNLVRRSAASTISTGAWRHVMVTWTGSATATNVRFYVDGVEVGYAATTDGSGTRANDGTSSLYIGNEPGTTRTFDGVIDDVRVYNRVLTTNEILAVYRAGL